MKRVLSGIKPTGQVTLGNYLGALKRWADEQDGSENYYFIPNLHALTVRPDRHELHGNTLAAAAWLIAMGVDPSKSTLFVQSMVSAHAELAWILNNYVTIGELNRMTQFKDKSLKQGAEGQLVGLYDYPVLMASDILLYDADEVPVGEDQKQHVELTRDIATRFNNLYGDTFKVPQPTVQKLGSRIMDLQDPTKKMSKSDADDSGCVLMSDSAELIRRKVKRAVTDSGSTIEATDDKPALTNLLQIYSMVSGKTVRMIEQDYAGKGYGEFKADLGDLLADVIIPLQQKHSEILSSKELNTILAEGAEKASKLANAKLLEVKEKLGLL